MKFTIESVSTEGVGQPPNVEFLIAADHRSFTARPDGAIIEVYALDQLNGRWRSRVILHDTVRGIVSADIVVDHLPWPAHPEWEDPALYAGEIACALYWSMWRMQQVRKLAAKETP